MSVPFLGIRSRLAVPNEVPRMPCHALSRRCRRRCRQEGSREGSPGTAGQARGECMLLKKCRSIDRRMYAKNGPRQARPTPLVQQKRRSHAGAADSTPPDPTHSAGDWPTLFPKHALDARLTRHARQHPGHAVLPRRARDPKRASGREVPSDAGRFVGHTGLSTQVRSRNATPRARCPRWRRGTCAPWR